MPPADAGIPDASPGNDAAVDGSGGKDAGPDATITDAGKDGAVAPDGEATGQDASGSGSSGGSSSGSGAGGDGGYSFPWDSPGCACDVGVGVSRGGGAVLAVPWLALLALRRRRRTP
jgi:hypothetical protein